MVDQDTVYTTDVVTTVRFTIRHAEPLDKAAMMRLIPEILGFEYLLGQDDYPSVQAYSVISDEIQNANTPEEQE